MFRSDDRMIGAGASEALTVSVTSVISSVNKIGSIRSELIKVCVFSRAFSCRLCTCYSVYNYYYKLRDMKNVRCTETEQINKEEEMETQGADHMTMNPVPCKATFLVLSPPPRAPS